MSDIVRHLLSPGGRRAYVTPIWTWLCCVVLSFVATGCIKNEFIVKADLPESVNSTYRVVYYAHDKRGGLTQETAITITGGHGELKGITRLPVCVMIFEGSSRSPAAIFYAERGDKIHITGRDASPYSWEISGNPLTDALSAWRLENRTTLMSGDGKSINKIVSKYVHAHPEEELSAVLLGLYYDRRPGINDDADIKQSESMESLISLLKGKAAEEAAIWLTDRADMMMPAEAGRTVMFSDPIIVQSYNNGADTIALSKNKPTLLVFRSYGTPGDDVLVDTLKSILRTYKDSTRRNIAELYLSQDSLNWTSAINRDTLPGMIRARLPREEAEPLALEAGVTRTPWWIVIDGKGKIRYQGPSAAHASRTFRPLVPKPKSKSKD